VLEDVFIEIAQLVTD
jgi:hypothetical protein